MTHADLVNAAYKWLLKNGCSFAFKELKSFAVETPDVIGWREGSSVLIECKMSLDDFKADGKKPFRVEPETGMGRYRFYLSPENVILPKMLPGKWGLLWLMDSGEVEKIIAPTGNIWSDWSKFEYNERAETLMLCSALRRVHAAGGLEKHLKNRRRDERINQGGEQAGQENPQERGFNRV